MPTLMLATSNSGKVAEFRALLALHLDMSQLTILTPRDWPKALPEVAETGATFAENARLKAQALAEVTGLPSLADDSGLCVDALGGLPGLRSARWAGAGASDADRNDLLLVSLATVPPERRTARFACVLALATPARETLTAEGVCEGLILNAPRGENGFGYDPLFFLPDLSRTMAELLPEEKNLVSHRARAMAGLAANLPDVLFLVTQKT